MQLWKIIILCIGLAGCYADPYRNPNNWTMTGAGGKTIAVMADPSDLISGKSDPSSNGVAAAAGVSKALGGAAGNAAGLQTVPTQPTMSLTGS